MTTKGFSLGDVIRTGCRKFKDHWGFLLSYFILTKFLYVTGLFFSAILFHKSKSGIIISDLALVLMDFTFGIGLIKACLAIVDGVRPSWRCMFSNCRLLLKCIVGNVLFYITFISGLILLVIPGIVWALKFPFYLYCIIDKGMGPVQALKESSKITNGAKWDILGWILTTSMVMGLFATTIVILTTFSLLWFTNSLENINSNNLYVIISLLIAILPLVSIFCSIMSVMWAYVYRNLDRTTLPDSPMVQTAIPVEAKTTFNVH